MIWDWRRTGGLASTQKKKCTQSATYALMAGDQYLGLCADAQKRHHAPITAADLDARSKARGHGPRGTASHRHGSPMTELLFDDLDAWLALVLAPIGSEITADITVRLDGRYSLELLKRGYQGLLFHNLPAGRHWVELRYGGQTQQVEVDLKGARSPR